MKILKFGGSSVGSAERIRAVAAIVKRAATESPCAVVVSAYQGVTDQLIELSAAAARSDQTYRDSLAQLASRHLDAVTELVPAAHRSSVLANVRVWLNDLEDILHGVFLVGECSKRMLDYIMSFGERLSAYTLSEHLLADGVRAAFLDARDLVKTDENFGGGRVDFDSSYANIQQHFAAHRELQIITGFIASTATNDTITLGRGGSDYTAALFGAALDCSAIEIWTDVDGVMTADPRKVKKAFYLPSLSYEEMMELSHFGAKVIYPPTIQPALRKRIPVVIKNTFKPEFPGSTIAERGGAHEFIVTGISSIERIALLRVQGSGMVGVAGVSMRLFGALARERINVILITQASSEHTICFAVEPAAAESARAAIESEFKLELLAQLVEPVVVETNLSIISVVGENMRHTPGIAGRLFQALGRNGINIVAIAQGSSELNISAVVSGNDEVKALNALHDQFFLSEIHTANLFLIGTGLIGSTLLEQIKTQAAHLRRDLSIELRLVGLLNRSAMQIDANGLTSTSGAAARSAGSLTEFIAEMRKLNLPNSIFVDCTASDDVAACYQEVLDSSIAVVTPNKRAQSGPAERFRSLKASARKRGVDFLYETSVGAGLPIINTLNDLSRSGDEIVRIEAVLSGTLSYIFNTLAGGERKFSEVVAEAKRLGYTEPDPRDDLSGSDVARKLLILARECGFDVEQDSIEIESLVPEKCRVAADGEEFMQLLPAHDSEWTARLAAASRAQRKLCYVAEIADGKARVALKEIGNDHPFFNLSGSDNIVSFTTKRYAQRPLVVKGPGAGAQVTAAGVFADIIRIANYRR